MPLLTTTGLLVGDMMGMRLNTGSGTGVTPETSSGDLNPGVMFSESLLTIIGESATGVKTGSGISVVMCRC